MGRDVFWLTIVHRQPVQMAAVIGLQLADKRRTPAGHKTEMFIQRAER